jgi:D-glycero-D-manno-heptose 1,7-bisphosphate phosphatase
VARAGYKVVITTSRAGIAHGMVSEAVQAEIHGYLTTRMAAAGVRLDGIYFCPHHPDAKVEKFPRACDCSKPKPGMVLQAERDLDLALPRSFVIGDRWRDLEMGQRAGQRGLLVRAGYGGTQALSTPDGLKAEAILANAREAANWVVRHAPLGR